MEETFPTADTKRLEEKHGVGVGVGASSTIAGGRDQKITSSGYNYQKEVQHQGSSSTIEVHYKMGSQFI